MRGCILGEVELANTDNRTKNQLDPFPFGSHQLFLAEVPVEITNWNQDLLDYLCCQYGIPASLVEGGNYSSLFIPGEIR